MTTTLSGLDWTICISYLLIVLALGVWFSRQQHDNEDYFVGGRTMHWFPIGLSLFAGTFSSLSFVGLPREAAYDDYHLLLAIFFIPLVVSPIVAWLFVPLYHRLKLTSAYEYLERRFDRRVRLTASLLFMLYNIGWIGNLLVAVGKILQVVLDLNEPQVSGLLIGVGLFATFYTALGGVKAVVWTDALQAFALGGGMLAVLFLAVGKVDGGWPAVWEIGSQHAKFEMFRMEFTSEHGNFFGACAFGFFVYLAAHAVHFTAVQRYVSMPTVRAARQSLIVNGVMVSAVCLVFFLVGSTLFAFYQQSGNELFDELARTDNGDQLLPHFVLTEIPGFGLTGLLLAGLFAAAMSSMDSGINSLTATVVCDWMTGRDSPSLKHSRILSLIFGVAAIAVALVLQQIGGPVFHMIMTIAGTLLGLLLGVFLLGMLSPRANSAGTLIGVASAIVVFTVAKLGGMSFWWDGACTSMTTLVVGLFASLLFPPPDAGALRGLEVGEVKRNITNSAEDPVLRAQ